MSHLNKANGIFRGITVEAQKKLKTDCITCLSSNKIKFDCPIEVPGITVNGDVQGDNLSSVQEYDTNITGLNANVSSFVKTNSSFYVINGDAFVNFEGTLETTGNIGADTLIGVITTNDIPNGGLTTKDISVGGIEFSNYYNFYIEKVISGSATLFNIRAGDDGLPSTAGFPIDLKFNIRYRVQ